jgi:outer membrane receptor for ferrienterochelin and colicin
MRKSVGFSIMTLLAVLISVTSFSQQTTISGRIKNLTTQEFVPAVSVQVKGSSLGTFTDNDGNFKISVPQLPVTLVVTSVGFETREIAVDNATASVDIELTPSSSLGQEVVVSATRSPERILESPVTVEKMSNVTLRNVPAPSYYEAISNMKGVDMHTASLTFRTVTTRGFISSGNTRLNQLIDGMDNQAPGLNFSVGSVIGLTELDVDNVELLAGASSALYGSGGMNGTLLINSKSPFKYQGLSLQVKQGVMHLSDEARGASPYYDWGFRWGKSFNDRFGFKIATQFIKANDWEAYDLSNVSRTSVLSKVVPGDRNSDPNYDGVNVYGDETSANMISVSQSVQAQTRSGILAATGNQLDVVAFLNANLPAMPTTAQINAVIGALPAAVRPAVTQMLPFYIGLRNNLIPNQNVSRTGYDERNLVDYNTMNLKATGGLFYKITPSIEASINSYVGTGTTVYTGADRYSLKNLKMAQHKLEVRSNRWFVRGYTTQENAGDSYNATVLGRLINEAWKPSTTWYPQYIGTYLQSRLGGANNAAAHQTARGFADQGRLLPGTEQFDNTANSIKNNPIPNGAKFLDRSDLWAAEGQLNISEALEFTNTVEIIAGAQWKQFVLNSQGTIFADTAGKFKPAEYGGYVQLKKRILNDKVTLTAAGRYDKHSNFEGRFTPRVTAVIHVAPENNIRVSYQTGYRFPTNQDQYINLNVGSGLLIGLLPEFQTYYQLNTNPGYTAESVAQFRASGNASALRQYQYQDVKPESVSSYELGYKGLLAKKLYLDAYGYYSNYEDFLGRVAVVQSMTGNPTGILNPLTSRNLSYIQNSDQQVNAFGWGVTAEYVLPRKFIVYGNVFSDQLVVDDKVLSGKDRETLSFGTFFNTPDIRYNIGVRNENVWKNIGFNIVWKYQAENYYEGTFVTGTLPSFGWLDGQVSYKVPNSKSIFRIGGTNIGNDYQRTGFGSPSVGGLYYVSFGYNIY